MKITRRQILATAPCLLAPRLFAGLKLSAHTSHTDVCVYGGTASGVMAAVAAVQQGCRVIVVEPSRWLGGMTGGGLSNIDWGRREAVGGTAGKILKDGISDPQYRQQFQELVKENGITVLYEHRLGAVRCDGKRIEAIELDYAPPDQFGCPVPKAKAIRELVVSARIFIDCSYEGDLMAKAGVSYTYGRESKMAYGESLAGVRPNMGVYKVDPYKIPGNPSSGLIPLLQNRQMADEGDADKLTMAYGFRWKFSFDETKLPINPPDNYDPWMFELYRRAFQNNVNLAGRHMRTLGIYEPEESHVFQKGAGNLSRSLLTCTVFGCNSDYPDGDWAARARIWKFQQEFMGGLTHFLRTDPSVPAALKKQASIVGFQPGIFDETSGWPHQMYVREARRMKSAYVLTQHDVAGETDSEDSVGLASYGVDEFPYATFPLAGQVAINGGDLSMLYLDNLHKGIYKIPYRAIVPLATDCTNLLVPVCCSASHIAMTSIRMEPVWMILGESAGVAASLALRAHVPVQEVEYKHLRAQLLELGQVLERPS